MKALRIILMHIQIMLHIPLSRNQASFIFKKAIKTLPYWEYMCLAIKDVACSKRIVTELAKFRFTRGNYHDFIKKNYPKFDIYLIQEYEGVPWIYGNSRDKTDILKTKREFLIYLSELCLSSK